MDVHPYVHSATWQYVQMFFFSPDLDGQFTFYSFLVREIYLCTFFFVFLYLSTCFAKINVLFIFEHEVKVVRKSPQI